MAAKPAWGVSGSLSLGAPCPQGHAVASDPTSGLTAVLS